MSAVDGTSGSRDAVSGRPSVLSLSITSRSALFSSYMPFLKAGGLFVPTLKRYALGEEVFMLLSLMDDANRLPIAGKVAWLTPHGAQRNKKQGVGIQFSEDESGRAAKTRIEALLGSRLDSARSTYSL